MRKHIAFGRPLWSLLLILTIVGLNLLPLLTFRVYAGTFTSRKITIGTSKTSAATTYAASIIPAQTTSIKGIVVDFCNSAGGGPIVGTACNTTNHVVSGIPTSSTLTVTQGGSSGCSGGCTFTMNTPGGGMSAGSALILTDAGGTGALNTTNPLTFSFAATNPTTCSGPSTCTFYGRMLSFSTTAGATTYDSTTAGANNPPTAPLLDSGSVALSTANQLTINARVQESLQFCVGATTANDSGATTVASDCSGTFTGGGGGGCGTTVDLGILDSGSVSKSPVPVSTASIPGGGNNCNGAAMVRTNASGGVIVTYFAEQETSSGKLKVIGSSCSGSSNTDQCFNDSTSQVAFTAGTEAFGVTVKGTNCNVTSTTSYTCDMTTSTNKLISDSPYIGVNATTFGDTAGWAWQDSGATTQLAHSTGPVDDETLILGFAATPTITTPTGSYTVTSTYVATSTF